MILNGARNVCFRRIWRGPNSAAVLAAKIRRRRFRRSRSWTQAIARIEGAQSEDQCADHLRLRRRAKGGEGGRSRDHARRHARPIPRRAGRDEGLLRFQARLGHDLRRHPRARELCRRPLLHVRRADGAGRRDLSRQDQQPGLRFPRHLRQLPLRPLEEPLRPDARTPADLQAAAPARLPPACCRSARERTAADRSASRPRGAASTDTSPRSAACRWSPGRRLLAAPSRSSSRGRSPARSRTRLWR